MRSIVKYGSLLVLLGMSFVATSCFGTGGNIRDGAGNGITPEKNTLVSTSRLVELIEKGDITYVRASHDGIIEIEETNGRSYRSSYKHGESGKYSRNPDLCNAPVLVNHILFNRPEEEVEGVVVEMESEKFTVIGTERIVELLENGPVSYISTSHDQIIDIELKNGDRYWGKYKPSKAGKYSRAPELSLVLNLVNHILESRPDSEIDGLVIEME